MKNALTAATSIIATVALAATCFADVEKGGKIDGKKEFEKHCIACHKDGGNVINPAKGLSKKAREANGVKGTSGIIAKMRNPGPGMNKFDKAMIPDKEAKAIADYITRTFK